MKDDESVSVIIASNRSGQYLAEAIASVRNQTASVAEIILVDDGSPGTALSELAESLGLTYLRQDAAGVSVARNRGIAASTGSLLIFLDDDDVFHPERVAAQQEALRANPAAAACYTGLWYLDQHGDRFGDPRRAPRGSAAQMLRGDVDLPLLGTMMIRRDTVTSAGGFHPAFRRAEDVELIFRLLRLGAFVAVDRELHGYRRHELNVTTDQLAMRTSALRAIRLQQWGAEAAGDPEFASFIEQNLRRYRSSAGHATGCDIVVALRRGEWASARKGLQWAARSAPGAAAVGAALRVAQWAQNVVRETRT